MRGETERFQVEATCAECGQPFLTDDGANYCRGCSPLPD